MYDRTYTTHTHTRKLSLLDVSFSAPNIELIAKHNLPVSHTYIHTVTLGWLIARFVASSFGRLPDHLHLFYAGTSTLRNFIALVLVNFYLHFFFCDYSLTQYCCIDFVSSSFVV